MHPQLHSTLAEPSRIILEAQLCAFLRNFGRNLEESIEGRTYDDNRFILSDWNYDRRAGGLRCIVCGRMFHCGIYVGGFVNGGEKSCFLNNRGRHLLDDGRGLRLFSVSPESNFEDANRWSHLQRRLKCKGRLTMK